ncbi:hypothetical protein ACFX13_028424 [Malus domestica]
MKTNVDPLSLLWIGATTTNKRHKQLEKLQATSSKRS